MSKMPLKKISICSPLFRMILKENASGAVSWADWPRENDPISGIWKELLLVVIYKNQASLRMYQFPGPLDSNLAS